MSKASLVLPVPKEQQAHVIAATEKYWGKSSHTLYSLPISPVLHPHVSAPLRLKSIRLPEWAHSCAVNGCILVPEEATSNSTRWETVDWWLAAFLLLEGWHERIFEAIHGPIHSYSKRLKDWDTRVWDYAWVNRIVLFLRLWTAHHQQTTADELFGAVPQSNIVMTHDVDAIQKTLPIRLKQSLFYAFNAQKSFFACEFKNASKKLLQSIRFLLGFENWWRFDALLLLEEKAAITSHFNFYADSRKKNFRSWLFDPSYSLNNSKLKGLFIELQKKNHVIGLHTSFDGWQSSHIIKPQQQNLSAISQTNVTFCRQHWLRFSWADTWHAQTESGIHHDTTLMFNDRPGFRAAAALTWKPWNIKNHTPHTLNALPTVLMDSHFYDYQMMDETSRCAAIKRWLEECRLVGGDAAVLWHPHTLTKDYNWEAGFKYLLKLISDMPHSYHAT